ncbi:MAG: FHA domain-containing protein [Halobacteriovoraceae bacterium]|jgi:hypothetical protein|nr:FHA domain-containing protein [Halobacteriovoraceae bacterium]
MKVKTCLSLIVNNEEVPLNTNKILVGSASNCDITIDHDSIAHYHAMIFVSDEKTVEVIDLSSQNGTYINGVKVGTNTLIVENDTLTFGKISCNLLENNGEVQFVTQDDKVQKYQELQAEKVYIPQANNENEILIDDEYCDIKFDDESFAQLENNPLHNHVFAADSYIETDNFENSFEMLEQTDGNGVQITTALNGSILEQFYYPIQDGTIYASSRGKKNSVVVDILNTPKKIELFKIENNKLIVNDFEDFQISQGSMELKENNTIVLSRGTYQVFIEVAHIPNNLLHISPLRRDYAFFKDTGKKFAAAIVPLLLILLVDFNPENLKPVKKLSIIYKKPTTANVDEAKMASTKPTDKKKNTGHKATKQPDKKITHSKSGAKAKPKKSLQKKVAKAQSKKSKVSKAKAKTKAYSFKMASNVSSMFNTSKAVSVTNSKSKSNIKTTSTVSGSLATKVDGTSSNKVGQMGSDAAGRAVASFGSKGLSSKSGRNTAYIQTETVVLGSMDPELLRKILQQYLPQFRHCYQQELAYNSEDIKGIVDLNFEITGSGKVSKIKVRAKDSRFSKKGTNCMARVLAVIDFPKPKGGGRVAVKQPLSFFSEQEKG